MQQRSLSQCLNQLSHIYRTGTIEFYAKLPNDPWQKAHDECEEALTRLPKDDKYFERAADIGEQLVQKCTQLIEKFKPFAGGAQESFPITGFMAPDEATSDARVAAQRKQCACGASTGLRVARHAKFGLGLYCLKCVPPEKKR